MDTLRVLVTDDEVGMRLGVARTLRDFRVSLPELDGDVRFDVDVAETGEAALEKIAQSPPQILLLDHKLPGLSGMEVLDRLHATFPDLLTVMITAYASIETAVSATKRGAYDFLAKPFTPEELRGTVRKAASHYLLMQRARRLAEEKRQVRFQFISVLAHELKSPLNAIEGYLQIIRDRSAGEDPAVYERMLDRSLHRIEGMRKMILDLLDLTRIESGQKRREIREVDVVAAAESALELALPDARERGITLELHARPPIVHRGDPGEIDIILNNLVSNAVKYNRDGGRVDVTLDKEGDRCRITVADTGIGMTSEECARLFNDFVRIKNRKTRDIPGSGLGLSIVRKLAALYRGEATVESVPDAGTTFRVCLGPVREVDKESEPVSVAASTPVEGD